MDGRNNPDGVTKRADGKAALGKGRGNVASRGSWVDELDVTLQMPPGMEVIPKLLRIMDDPQTPSEDIVDVIRLDSGLTTDVLRVCNSAAYGGSCVVETIAVAVNRLGLRELYRIVLEAVASSSFRKVQELGPPIVDLWEHSLTSAVAAQVLALRAAMDAERAFTAGLLHDIGKLVLWQQFGNQYREVSAQAGHAEKSLIEIERERWGIDHAAIGGRILTAWNFPEEIVAAVEFHHDYKGDSGHILALAALSNQVAHALEPAANSSEDPQLSKELLAQLDLSAADVLASRSEIQTRVAREKALLR
jgi:putative nucleotidyltransferase with HDIG domain